MQDFTGHSDALNQQSTKGMAVHSLDTDTVTHEAGQMYATWSAISTGRIDNNLPSETVDFCRFGTFKRSL